MGENKAAKRLAEVSTKATPKQVKFIESLLIDCLMSSIRVRNEFLTRECERQVVYIDMLTMDEASMLIDKLIEIRDRTTPAKRSDPDEDDGDAGWNRRKDSR